MAKAYAICGDTKCKREVYTKEDIDNMFLVSMNEFRTVEASVITPNDGSTTSVDTTVNYPEGFNKGNCIVVSVMSKNRTLNKNWATTSIGSAASYLRGNSGVFAVLDDSNIKLGVQLGSAVNSSWTWDIRVTLMKIAEG